ncbi:macrophage migration inhibitory factor [Phlyctema vagabunda]|uniref:L-dopachrome isomerase n=1 Tax=Phlyctema vagabunda TaxID=108571 RepID=A0ABR4P7Y9_9HELO
MPASQHSIDGWVPELISPLNLCPPPAKKLPLASDKDQIATTIVNRTKKEVIQAILPPSPADSMLLESPQHPVPSPTTTEERKIMREIDRGAPGDQAIFSELKTPEQKEFAKRKSQHYNEAFACREPNSSARERVCRESIVMADVRTNVIIQDEYTFITDLSYTLSSRYQRPESSILVAVTHSACLLFGGSFDPAYTMTITALPSQVQQVTNKRNAALLQKNMEEALGVAPDRGLIKFMAIPEENLATNGKTAAGEIEELELAENGGRKTTSRKSSAPNLHPKGSKRKSTRSLRNLPISLSTHDEQMTPPPSDHKGSPPPMPPMPTSPSTMDKKVEKIRKMSKRKSFMNSILGRT